MKTEKTFKCKKMLVKFTQFCNFKNTLGKIRDCNNCCSGI